MTVEPSQLDRLRAALRDSKALTGRGQEVLDSAGGSELVAAYEEFIGRALAQQRPDLAKKAAESLANILDKTANLEYAQRMSTSTEHRAVQIILDMLGDATGPQTS